MRVAHISDCYLPRTGGIELQVRGLSQAQKRSGMDPIVITATPHSKTEPVVQGETDEGVPIHRLAVRLPADLPVSPYVGKRLRELLRDVDVVHVHGGLVSAFAWPALRTAVHAGIPAVVSVHSVWASWARAFAAADLIWHWRSWPVLWTGVSDLAVEGINAALAGRGNVRVLHNGIDVDRWRPSDPDELPATVDVTMVSVARLAMRKRAMALIDMLEKTRQRVPDSIPIKAVLVGDGPDRSRIERAIDHRNLTWIELAGWQTHDQIRNRYLSSSIYVSPSRLESFGIAALEARTAGLPVVALADSGVTEFIHQGVEGLLANDDAGMVDALSRLCTSPALLDSIRLHNRRVAPPFDWPHIVGQSVACYRTATDLVT